MSRSPLGCSLAVAAMRRFDGLGWLAQSAADTTQSFFPPELSGRGSFRAFEAARASLAPALEDPQFHRLRTPELARNPDCDLCAFGPLATQESPLGIWRIECGTALRQEYAGCGHPLGYVLNPPWKEDADVKARMHADTGRIQCMLDALPRAAPGGGPGRT